MVSIRKKVVVNTVSNYALRGVQIILGFFAIPIIVNNLGQEAFGLIMLANVIVGYFVLFEMGLPAGVTKYVAEYLAKEDFVKVNEIINTTLIVFFLLGIIISVLVLSFVLLGGLDLFNISSDNFRSARHLLLIASGLAIFNWPRRVLEGTFQGIQKYHKLNLTLAVGRIASICLAIAASILRQPLEMVFIAFNIDKIATGIWQYLWLKREIPSWDFRIRGFDISVFKLIFAFSGWLMLSQLAVMLEYQCDQVIIGAALPVAMITVYTIIFYPFRTIQQISGLLCAAVMPAVSENEMLKGKQGVDVFIYKGVKYHNLVFAPFAIIGAFLCSPFIRLWMGAEYLTYVWIAQLACLFQLLWQSNALLGQVYFGTGRSKKPGLIAIFIGVLNVTLSVWWVNIFGLPGVIMATLLAGLIGVPLFYWLIFPDLNIHRWFYLKDIIIKAQMPIWIAGLVFLPFWKNIQQINGWFELFLIGAIMLLFMYGSGFVFVVDKTLKENIFSTIGRVVLHRN